MSQFERKLTAALNEMAELAAWRSPAQINHYTVYYGNGTLYDKLGIIAATNEQEAISKLKDHPKLKNHDFSQIALELDERPERGTLEYFGNTDVELIRKEKTRKTIEQWLNDNDTPFSWIMVFDDQSRSYDRSQNKVYSFERQNDLLPTPGKITFLKSGNAGEDPLTPHMILHTIGHAVTNHFGEAKLNRLKLDIGEILINEKIMTNYRTDVMMTKLCQLLHMKSALKTVSGVMDPRKIVNFDELVNEVVAIYVKNGRIKVEPNQYCEFDISQQAINDIKSYLELYCHDALTACVGQIIEDD